MRYELITPAVAELDAFAQGQSGNVDVLQQHVLEAQIRSSDLMGQLGRLHEQYQAAGSQDKVRLEKPIADLEHQNAVAAADLDMAQRRLNMLMAQSTMQPPHESLIDRSLIEKTGTGVFLLMIPIAFALARRLWVRSGQRVQPQLTADIESSPRLQRIEEAIESIAIEVERIGEAQRFATKLLTERQDPVVNRAVPAATPIVRKAPGTITPH